MKMNSTNQPIQKDLSLLDSSLSPTSVDSISDRITRIERELGRGAKVYSPEEIRLLERKLLEYREMLRVLTSP